MPRAARKVVCVHGRSEPVLEEIRVRGRSYFLLERLSSRGAFRVYDPNAGPGGDYRALYRIPFSRDIAQCIRTLSRLGRHGTQTNFPIITDYARQGDELIVVMTWIAGTGVRALLHDVRNGAALRPSVPVVCRLMRGLAHGVAQYHRRINLIHGDISPANLILTPRTTRLVLVDFGSAWPIEFSATKVDGDGVTPPYAAPERIARHALEDVRSDQFSLCVVWYELMTLDIPFDGAGGRAGLPQNVAAHAATFVAPSQKVASRRRIPSYALELLDETLRVGLALHPDQRFATTADWLDAVDRLEFALRPFDRLSRTERWWLGRVTWFETRLKGLFCK